MRKPALCFVFALCLLTGGVTEGRAAPYEIAASWVADAAHLRPLAVDFRFQSIRNVPDVGVIAIADHLLLRITDGKPFVTLGWKDGFGKMGPPTGGVAAIARDELVFANAERLDEGAKMALPGRLRGVLVRLRQGRWEEFPLPPVPPAYTSFVVSLLRTGASGEIYAAIQKLGTSSWLWKPRRINPRQSEPMTHLYRYHNAAWQALPAALRGATFSNLSLCIMPNGQVWTAGEVLSASTDGSVTGKRGFVALYNGNRWHQLDPPPPRQDNVGWAVHTLVCKDSEHLWAVGGYTRHREKIGLLIAGEQPLLYVFENGRWRQILDLPPRAPSSKPAEQRYWGIGAATVDAAGELWVAYDDDARCKEPLYRLGEGGWQAFALPEVPAVGSYRVEDMAFDDSGDGWAISNVWGGVQDPRSHGILLRFENGAWHNQNWHWSLLRQRWFGLLGDLR